MAFRINAMCACVSSQSMCTSSYSAHGAILHADVLYEFVCPCRAHVGTYAGPLHAFEDSLTASFMWCTALKVHACAAQVALSVLRPRTAGDEEKTLSGALSDVPATHSRETLSTLDVQLSSPSIGSGWPR